MASNAIASSSVLHMSEPDSTRPQADPLPQKRGEIGFRESVHGGVQDTSTREADTLVMPARHPADRDPTPAPSASTAPSSSSSSSTSSTTTSTTTPATQQPSADGSSMRKSTRGAAGFFFTLFRKQRKDIKVGGMRLTLLLRFVVQVLFIAGTIAAWVIIIKHLMSPAANPVLPIPLSNDPNDNGDGSDNNDNGNGNGPMAGSTSAIFVHVAFGVSTLAQLLFLERCIFQLRAQRYCHLHPGSTLPTHSHSRSMGMGGGGPAMGFAPWNRPPLPTYAAALAQSGYGTGDVEDSQIAIPPPPAYGNTRGSTLLLAGFLRNSIRSGNDGGGGGGRGNGDGGEGGMEDRGRPVSYRSTDEEWEERCDAERALRLEQTLARLEDSSASASSTVTRPKPAAR